MTGGDIERAARITLFDERISQQAIARNAATKLLRIPHMNAHRNNVARHALVTAGDDAIAARSANLAGVYISACRRSHDLAPALLPLNISDAVAP